MSLSTITNEYYNENSTLDATVFTLFFLPASYDMRRYKHSQFCYKEEYIHFVIIDSNVSDGLELTNSFSSMFYYFYQRLSVIKHKIVEYESTKRKGYKYMKFDRLIQLLQKECQTNIKEDLIKICKIKDGSDLSKIGIILTFKEYEFDKIDKEVIIAIHLFIEYI
jgi:hypothetical protein